VGPFFVGEGLIDIHTRTSSSVPTEISVHTVSANYDYRKLAAGALRFARRLTSRLSDHRIERLKLTQKIQRFDSSSSSSGTKQDPNTTRRDTLLARFEAAGKM